MCFVTTTDDPFAPQVAMSGHVDIMPCQTIYIRNLDDKINKEGALSSHPARSKRLPLRVELQR